MTICDVDIVSFSGDPTGSFALGVVDAATGATAVAVESRLPR